jgi:hypothetical protein
MSNAVKNLGQVNLNDNRDTACRRMKRPAKTVNIDTFGRHVLRELRSVRTSYNEFDILLDSELDDDHLDGIKIQGGLINPLAHCIISEATGIPAIEVAGFCPRK